MIRSTFSSIRNLLFAGLLMVPLIPQAKAIDMADWSQKTVFTFNKPVAIPGMVLRPGTYVFQVLGNESNRNFVEIFNKTQTRLVATVATIPARTTLRGRNILTFEERAANQPEAIHDWFYPGMVFGHEFVYHQRG